MGCAGVCLVLAGVISSNFWLVVAGFCLFLWDTNKKA